MQETNENKELIENIDNIAEEQTGEKNQSASKIFFFVLGLHVLVIAGAIALHTMRGPSGTSPQTDTSQSGAAQQPLVQSGAVGNSSSENNPTTLGSLHTHPLQADASSSEKKTIDTDKAEVTTPEPELLAQTPQEVHEQELPISTSAENGAQQPAETVYIVRPGDSLSVIARRHNTTTARILRDNAKNNEKIVVGERLLIKSGEATVPASHSSRTAQTSSVKLPVAKVQQQIAPPIANPQTLQASTTMPPPKAYVEDNTKAAQTAAQNTSPVVAASANPLVHTVKKGDTLFSISRKYGTSVENIKKWNAMQTDKLTVGKTLLLSAPVAPSQSSTLQASAQTNTQTVTDTDASRSADAQKLQAPSVPKTRNHTAHPTSTIVHTVSAGETLSSVARKYNTTVQSIKQDNELATDFITIGQKLAVTPGASATQSQWQSDAALVHVVRPGDTLSSISRSYGVPIEALFAANQLRNPNIRVGQKLVIPASVSEKTETKNSNTGPTNPANRNVPAPTNPEKQEPEIYTVQPGDTLFKIALKYGLSVESLSEANNITGADILRVGQELVIPHSNISEVAKN